MTKDELAAERRRQARLHRLGTDEPRCGTCGEADPRCLERHHVAGRRQDGDTTVLACRNCHARLSDAQKDHPRRIGVEPHPLERVAHFLLGLADLLALAVERLRNFGRELIARAHAELAGAGGVRS